LSIIRKIAFRTKFQEKNLKIKIWKTISKKEKMIVGNFCQKKQNLNKILQKTFFLQKDSEMIDLLNELTKNSTDKFKNLSGDTLRSFVCKFEISIISAQKSQVWCLTYQFLLNG